MLAPGEGIEPSDSIGVTQSSSYHLVLAKRGERVQTLLNLYSLSHVFPHRVSQRGKKDDNVDYRPPFIPGEIWRKLREILL